MASASQWVLRPSSWQMSCLATRAMACPWWVSVGLQCCLLNAPEMKQSNLVLWTLRWSWSGQACSCAEYSLAICIQGTMVAGYDPSGPALYYVDSDGQRTKGQIFSVGSGSLYAYGVLDAGYKWCVAFLSVSCSTAHSTRSRKRLPQNSGTTSCKGGTQGLCGDGKAACEGTWTSRMPLSSAGGLSTMPPSVTLSVEAQSVVRQLCLPQPCLVHHHGAWSRGTFMINA